MTMNSNGTLASAKLTPRNGVLDSAWQLGSLAYKAWRANQARPPSIAWRIAKVSPECTRRRARPGGLCARPPL